MAALAAPGVASMAKEPPPVAGGRIGTLSLGRYQCELPGDAGGPIGQRLPDNDFTVANASSYKAGGVRGSYLYTGNTVVMTGGKFKGLHFRRVSSGFLQETDASGVEKEMRCVLVTPRR